MEDDERTDDDRRTDTAQQADAHEAAIEDLPLTDEQSDEVRGGVKPKAVKLDLEQDRWMTG